MKIKNTELIRRKHCGIWWEFRFHYNLIKGIDDQHFIKTVVSIKSRNVTMMRFRIKNVTIIIVRNLSGRVQVLNKRVDVY